MNVLAIDTATESMGIAAVSRDGKRFALSIDVGLRHAQSLAPWVERALAELGYGASELDLVVCSQGPGSFTGVRIGMSTAKGLALGAGCPVVAVPSLDAIALRLASFPGVTVALIDARKGRAYAAAYQGGHRRSEYLDLSPQELLPAIRQWRTVLLTGPFARTVHAAIHDLLNQATRSEPPEEALSVALDPEYAYTDPRVLLELGLEAYRTRGGDAEPLAPLYLRPSEAELRRRTD